MAANRTLQIAKQIAQQRGCTVADAALALDAIKQRRLKGETHPGLGTGKRALAYQLVAQGRAVCLSDAIGQVDELATATQIVSRAAEAYAVAHPGATWQEALEAAQRQIDLPAKAEVIAYLKKVEELAQQLFRASKKSLAECRVDARKSLDAALRRPVSPEYMTRNTRTK